jgi:hypothetical protein
LIATPRTPPQCEPSPGSTGPVKWNKHAFLFSPYSSNTQRNHIAGPHRMMHRKSSMRRVRLKHGAFSNEISYSSGCTIRSVPSLPRIVPSPLPLTSLSPQLYQITLLPLCVPLRTVLSLRRTDHTTPGRCAYFQRRAVQIEESASGKYGNRTQPPAGDGTIRSRGSLVIPRHPSSLFFSFRLVVAYP